MRKNIIFGVIIFILLAAMGAQWWYFRQVHKQDLRSMSQLSLNNTELQKERNKLGQEVSTYKSAVFTYQQLNAIGDSTIRAMRKDLKYWKNIASHTGITSTTTDSLKIPVTDTMWRTPDSVPVYAKKFSYTDPWVTLHGRVIKSQVELEYAIKNEVNIDSYWKRDHWYAKRYLAGSITQMNPHTTTGKVVQFTVVEEPRKWYEKWWVHEMIGFGIGLTVGKLTP